LLLHQHAETAGSTLSPIVYFGSVPIPANNRYRPTVRVVNQARTLSVVSPLPTGYITFPFTATVPGYNTNTLRGLYWQLLVYDELTGAYYEASCPVAVDDNATTLRSFKEVGKLSSGDNVYPLDDVGVENVKTYLYVPNVWKQTHVKVLNKDGLTPDYQTMNNPYFGFSTKSIAVNHDGFISRTPQGSQGGTGIISTLNAVSTQAYRNPHIYPTIGSSAPTTQNHDTRVMGLTQTLDNRPIPATRSTSSKYKTIHKAGCFSTPGYGQVFMPNGLCPLQNSQPSFTSLYPGFFYNSTLFYWETTTSLHITLNGWQYHVPAGYRLYEAEFPGLSAAPNKYIYLNTNGELFITGTAGLASDTIYLVLHNGTSFLQYYQGVVISGRAATAITRGQLLYYTSTGALTTATTSIVAGISLQTAISGQAVTFLHKGLATGTQTVSVAGCNVIAAAGQSGWNLLQV
jgi:hypothetical protein